MKNKSDGCYKLIINNIIKIKLEKFNNTILHNLFSIYIILHYVLTLSNTYHLYVIYNINNKTKQNDVYTYE